MANYVEPFFGSGAVLLGRPHAPNIETVNDKDGFVANAWRSLRLSPAETARWADNPVNENDLHARHVWLLGVRDALSARLEGDPEYHNPKIAGWWIWGQSCWIGSGWCSGKGPWVVENGLLVDSRQTGNAGNGIMRQRPHLSCAGQGINRQLPRLSGAGQGVNRKLPHLGAGQGINRALIAYFVSLAERLRNVRVCSGDWSRVCGPCVTHGHGITGVVLDPPYAAETGRDMTCYSVESGSVAHDVRAWCLENGQHPLLRIALCGYDTEHAELERHGWTVEEWSAIGGYNSAKSGNRHRERIWFSPACIASQPKQRSLFV